MLHCVHTHLVTILIIFLASICLKLAPKEKQSLICGCGCILRALKIPLMQFTLSKKTISVVTSPLSVSELHTPQHHFMASLSSTVSLVRPVEVMGMCGAGGTWQMVQGQGSPDQCWKPEPSCS